MFFIKVKMNFLFFVCLFFSAAIFVSLEKNEKNKEEIKLNFTQIADFIEALKQKIQNKNSVEKMEKNGGKIVAKIAQKNANFQQNDVQSLLDEILDIVSDAREIIAVKCAENIWQKSEKVNGENKGNAIEEELSEKLMEYELNRLGSKLIKEGIFNYYQRNISAKSKVFKWWTRYRYKVNSVLCRNDVPINAIRMSFFQYYFGVFSNFNDTNKNIIKKEKPCLAEVVAELGKFGKKRRTIGPEITGEEQRQFEPTKELPQMTLDILMAQTKNGTPIFVLTERFCRKFWAGHFYEAIGVNHRAVKIYDIEFHFANDLGLFIYEKQRSRHDPNRGIKFTQVGITHKTQWEVQQIFDKFSEIYEENGQFKKGKFGIEKYDFFKQNCVHFAKEFVEKLMEEDNILKDKKWPPKVLRQSPFNKNKYKKLAMCVMG